ncbi:indole-3-glycerol phosphate synthase TrpC [Prolixibacteraceae bacterium JC049]|nr:indole-3-glycerol phosphate synthase TrpC [Prolixibacteraceae bacterium JC049]
MTILDQIIAHKRREIGLRKQLISMELIQKYPFFEKTIPSFSEYIVSEEKTGIIAEFKRESPSRGVINNQSTVLEVTKGYEREGASAVSVLTDTRFFGGTLFDLKWAKSEITIPILRKDFVVDEFQIFEAKGIGASAILLIAAVLTKEEIKRFTKLAHQLGLEVLLELYAEEELVKISGDEDCIGINNRDLHHFEVNIEKSEQMVPFLPEDKVLIAESGIYSVGVIERLRKAGFSGFLMGDCFMREQDPAAAFKQFVINLKQVRA